jgi:enoyl-CoA hydratase/carnithine racemase
VLAQVAANPRAAGVMVELLRILPSLSLDDGLVAESLAYGVLQGSDEFSRWLDLRGPAAALPSGRVMLERAGPILRITLDRPQADNAIDAPMRDELASALELALLDSTIERVELRGAGRSFSLGADLAEFGTTRDPARAHAIRRQTLPARLAARLGERLEAHVQGACVGAGLELAAYAGRITAGPRAWFQLPELAMGLLPGAGGCVSLVRRIGRQKTALLYLSGKRISALTAFEWGLVDEITGDDDGSDESGI